MHPSTLSSIKVVLIWQPLCMYTLTTFKWMTNDNIVIFWMTIKLCWKDNINTLSFFVFCEIKNEKWKHFHFSILVFEKSKLKNENTFVFRFLFCEIKNEKRKHFCFSFWFLRNQKRKMKTLSFFILVFMKSKTKNENTFVFCFLFLIFQNEKRMDADIHGPRSQDFFYSV